MTDTTITAFDFYNTMPTDMLMRMRDSHTTSLQMMTDILAERELALVEATEGFWVEDEFEDRLFAGETIDEAFDFVTNNI